MTSEHARPDTAGLILCGGRSRRMGMDKARLRFPGGTLLERVVRRMGEVAGVVVLSLAHDQDPATLPPLPAGVLTVRDREADQGPLWGLAEGFRQVDGRAGRVVVMPVDMPFFTPPWMARLVDGLADEGGPYRACLYEHEGFSNALTAAYDTALRDRLERLQAENRRRPIYLIEDEPTRVIPVGPEAAAGGGHPLTDVDTPEAYRDALLAEGVGVAGGAPVLVEVHPAGAAGGAPDRVALYAATAGDVTEALARLFSGDDARGAGAWRVRDAGAPETALAGDAALAPESRLLAGPAA